MTLLTNIPIAANERTTTYFNNFFGPNFSVPQDLDNSIIGFFERITANRESAKILAGSMIYTSKMQNLDPLVVLQQFAALPPGALSSYLVMFLNLNRFGTSLLGISNAPVPNKYIQRAILP